MRCVIVILFSILASGLIAQDDYYLYIDYDGDTTKLPVIQSPTICDCIHKDWRNKDQKAICERVYDYDFMSEQEKDEYNEQARICRYPSVCDCAEADLSDKGLIQKCDEMYFGEYISDSRIEEIKEELAACKEDSTTREDELDVCDCINIGDDYSLKHRCDEKFFNEDLSEEQRIEIEKAVQECIEKSSYELEVTICDCAQFSSDPEFLKACKDQYDTTKMDSVELVNYQLDMVRCMEDVLLDDYIDSLNFHPDSSLLSVCDCIDLPNTPESVDLKIACIKQWDLSKMTNDQLAAYQARAKRCESVNEIMNNIDFCDCVLKSEELTEKEQQACDELFDEMDPEDLEFLLEECYYIEYR